jgi:hypothetical protein
MITGGTKQPMFRWDAVLGRLYINTPTMKMIFANGAVIHLSDSIRHEALVDCAITENMPTNKWVFIGFASINAGGGVHERWGQPATASFVASGMVGTLTYDPCYRSTSQIAGTKLVYVFTIDISGDISITVTATEAEAGYVPYTVDIPIMNFSGASVITQARKILYDDANVTLLYIGNGGTVPISIGKCNDSCFGVWSDNDKKISEYINIQHTQSSHTHMILHTGTDANLKTGPDPKQVAINNMIIVGGPWRFTVQEEWLGVANQWRAVYNTATPDNKPLWEKSPAWVQDVHCRYGMHHPSDYATKLPDVVGQGIAAANIIVDPYGLDFNGNGESMIIYGQHEPRLTITYPSLGEIAKLAELGLRSIGYWFWDCVQNNLDAKVQSDQAYVPSDWLVAWNAWVADPGQACPFNPDYDGEKTPAAWLAYWDNCTTLYSGFDDLIHPGSPKWLETYLPIFQEHCRLWGFSGCFWDTAFVDRDGKYFAQNPEIRLINNKSFMDGCVDAAKSIYETLVIIPEYFSHHLMPYTFYTWEGVGTWLDGSRVINHPIRAALIGSYVWSKDIRLTNPVNFTDYSHEYFAFLGCIPQFCLDTDYHAPTFGNKYFTARAKMFCDYELFYDLPTTWGDVAVNLAWYRSNLTPVMVKFVKVATGRYAYQRSDTDAVLLQHELKTGVSCPTTLAVVFADTYTETPTVTAVEVVSGNAVAVSNLTTTGCTFTTSGTLDINWLVFGK